MGPHKTSKLLNSKGNNQFSKEEAWNGIKSCQLYIWQQTAIWNVQITLKKKKKAETLENKQPN